MEYLPVVDEYEWDACAQPKNYKHYGSKVSVFRSTETWQHCDDEADCARRSNNRYKNISVNKHWFACKHIKYEWVTATHY